MPPHDSVKFSEFLSKCWTPSISLMSASTGSNIMWIITWQRAWAKPEPCSCFTQHWTPLSQLLNLCYDDTSLEKKHTQNMMHPLKSAFMKPKLLFPSNRLWSVNVRRWLTSLRVPWGAACSGACIRSLNVSIVQMCSLEIHITGITYSYCKFFFIWDVWFLNCHFSSVSVTIIHHMHFLEYFSVFMYPQLDCRSSTVNYDLQLKQHFTVNVAHYVALTVGASPHLQIHKPVNLIWLK